MVPFGDVEINKMLPSTKQAVNAILNADPSLTLDQKKAFRVVLDGPLIQSTALPRVIRREEAAQILSVSVKRVDQLSRAGILRRVQAPGTCRAIGIAEESLRSLLSVGVVSVQGGACA